jgi:hypothetical protein
VLASADLDFKEVPAFCVEHGIAGGRSYFFSKEALIVWTMQSRWTWRSRGIRMNAVSPGPVDTPILKDFIETLGARAEEDMNTMDRPGKPGDIAPVVAFLLSDSSVWIPGDERASGWRYVFECAVWDARPLTPSGEARNASRLCGDGRRSRLRGRCLLPLLKALPLLNLRVPSPVERPLAGGPTGKDSRLLGVGYSRSTRIDEQPVIVGLPTFDKLARLHPHSRSAEVKVRGQSGGASAIKEQMKRPMASKPFGDFVEAQ